MIKDICPGCEAVSEQIEIRKDDGGIFFYCHICKQEWENDECTIARVMNHEITISKAAELLEVSVERVRKWFRD